MSQSKRNRIFRNTVFFGLGGLLITLSLYLFLFQHDDLAFTFKQAAQLHKTYPVLLFFDLFPFLGLYLGYWLTDRWLIRLNRLEQRIRKDSYNKQAVKEFINDLIQGNLESNLTADLSENDLTDALVRLQQTLSRNREEVKQRKHEDDQRNWVSEGIAQIGDLLRTYTDDMENLAYTVISFLVRYLKANQGGFFIVEGEDPEKKIRMIACHAYERRKFPDSVINWGEGLIGAVALEKKSYYTNRIPDGYLTITSGLGKANPGFLLITPLILNNTVYGVVEIASFKPIETYQLNFIERAAESIAVTLNAIESSIRTSQLLRETQAQAAKLALQEEQVRKNIEELKITQDEAARQAEKFISFTNSVNHTLIRAEYNTDGILLYANTKFLKKLGYSGNRDVEGKPISMFIHEKDLEWFNGMWKKLAGGGQHFEGYMKHITRQGQDLWTMATYTCVRKDDGGVEKILFLAIDSTDYKKQSLDYESQLEAINRLSHKAQFTPDGKFLSCNQLFAGSFKYTEQEMLQMNVFDFITRSDQERINEVWENVTRGLPFQGQLRFRNKYEDEIWFRATFTSVNDMYGEVERVIFIAHEITKEKEMESEMIRQHEQLLKKEEEFRLLSLDLQKKLDESIARRDEEKAGLRARQDLYLGILRQLPMPVILFNNLGYLVLVNKAAEKLFGVKNDRVSGTRLSLLFNTGTSDELISSLADPALQKKEGHYRSVRFSVSGGDSQKADFTLMRQEFGEEVLYTLIILR
ncbi:MAG: PAS domain S-box protein [Bacteroidota bacterium]